MSSAENPGLLSFYAWVEYLPNCRLRHFLHGGRDATRSQGAPSLLQVIGFG